MSLKNRFKILPSVKLEDLPEYQKTLTEVKEEYNNLLDSTIIPEN